MEEDKEKEEGEESENENLRELILQQLATLESSETSDDDSYKVRLSCILEDDESESSGAQKEAGKKKGRPEGVSESETSDNERVQITDLDDVTLCEKVDADGSDTTNDESERNEGFAIKKLKSSDNVPRRPFVVRRRELSSDSSDLDTSVTNSAEGHSSDVKIVEVSDEGDEEKTLNLAGEVESEEEEERRGGKGMELERVDNESLAPIFAKVSRTYLEKTKSNVKWEENEKIDFVFKELVEEVKKARASGQLPGDHVSLQDVHIRGTAPKVYDPPVPPETYLWEELKRLRERGGYPWTYLDKPPFDEATWKKYIQGIIGKTDEDLVRNEGMILGKVQKEEMKIFMSKLEEELKRGPINNLPTAEETFDGARAALIEKRPCSGDFVRFRLSSANLKIKKADEVTF